MLHIYEYYIEGYARANEHADNNFKWCKRYYNEVYKDRRKYFTLKYYQNDYNECYEKCLFINKLAGIIPHMSI